MNTETEMGWRPIQQKNNCVLRDSKSRLPPFEDSHTHRFFSIEGAPAVYEGGAAPNHPPAVDEGGAPPTRPPAVDEGGAPPNRPPAVDKGEEATVIVIYR